MQTSSLAGAPSPVVVEVEGLVRRYGARRAVAGVSFSLSAGEGLAVFGPNGAGKSTLLKVLAGLLKPSEGRAVVGGESLEAGASARARAGFVAHGSMLYGALTARENVEFAARMQGLVDPGGASAQVLARIGAREHASTPVRSLSRGLQQRISIARALVHSPAVLLLDEPFSGLDEPGSRRLAELLLELRAGGSTIIVVTHNISEGLSLATHCAIMLGGIFARMDNTAGMEAHAYGAVYHGLVSYGT